MKMIRRYAAIDSIKYTNVVELFDYDNFHVSDTYRNVNINYLRVLASEPVLALTNEKKNIID